MEKIILRIRPTETMDDLDLELIRQRIEPFEDWSAELHDTRLSDATYVTVTVEIPALDEKSLARLKTAFAGLPRMRAMLFRRVGVEIALETANAAKLHSEVL